MSPFAGMSLIPVLFNMPLVLLPGPYRLPRTDDRPGLLGGLRIGKGGTECHEPPAPEKRRGDFYPADPCALSLLQGFVVLAVVLVVYWSALSRGLGEGEVRALTFTTIVIANLCLILTNRSCVRYHSHIAAYTEPCAGMGLSGTIACLLLVLYVPWLQDLFRFAAISPVDLIACILTGSVSVLWFEGYKILVREQETALVIREEMINESESSTREGLVHEQMGTDHQGNRIHRYPAYRTAGIRLPEL